MQCTFGTQPKPGAPLFVWLLWNGFIAWIASIPRLARLGSISWLWWPDVPIRVEDFCAEEITIPTEPTLADWLGMLTFDPVAHATVENYLLAMFRASVWATVCECVPDPSPSATCYPAYPTAPAFANTASAGNANWAWGFRFTPTAAGLSLYGVRFWPGSDETSPVGLRVWDCTTTANKYFGSLAWSGSGPVTIYFPTPIPLTSGHNYTVAFVLPTGHHIMLVAGGLSTTNGPVTYGPSYINTDAAVINCVDSRTDRYGIDAIICDADPRGLIPYVPPDPADPTDIPNRADPICTTTADLCAAINRLSAQIATVDRSVNWLQSAAAPTGYALGTAHSVSGSGNFAVQDIVGLLVECVAPTMWRKTLETPPRHVPKLGALHFGNAAGGLDEQQVHYTSQLVMGPPPLTTVVAYSFGTGVTSTITELQRLK
jgi:hypothetical protein